MSSIQGHPSCVRGSREDMMAAAATNSHSGMSTSQSAILVDDPEAWRSTWTSRVTRNSHHHHHRHPFDYLNCWCWSGLVFIPGLEHSFRRTALPSPLSSGVAWQLWQGEMAPIGYFSKLFDLAFLSLLFLHFSHLVFFGFQVKEIKFFISTFLWII